MSKSSTQRHISPKALLGLVVALIVAFLLLLSVINVAQKYFGIRRHIRDLATEKTELEAKHAKLEERNAYLATSEGTETILREKYNVTKPGEGIVVVVDPTPSIPEGSEKGDMTWWQKILAGLGLRKK
jgi:cell division protein FtsB